MTRVKVGPVAKKRRRKVLKQAKGYFGSKHRLYKTAHEQVMRSGAYAYRDRKQKKRDFRKLWITRINAACKENGISYSKFINGLKIANIDINRKMLSELAINDPASFSLLVKNAQDALDGKIKPTEVKEEKPKAETKKEEKPKVEAKKEEEIIDLSTKKLTELKEIAKEKGLKGYSTLKKDDLIKLIKGE